jgi:uncharacterized membrane protein YqjE
MIDFQTSCGGLLGSLRHVFDTGASIVKNRIELAALELKEEKSHLLSAAVWSAIFLFSSFLAVIAVTCTLFFLFWEQRLFVASGLLTFCFVGAIVAFLILKRRLKTPKPFGETIAQFKKDRAWLKG